MEQRGPWKIKEIVDVYDSKWLKLSEFRVVHPDRSDGIFPVAKIIDGVSVLPIDDKGNVYLIKEYKFALGEEDIECASGAQEEGDSFLEAAKKELKEELGIEAEEWIDLGSVFPHTTNVQSEQKMYVARGLKFGETDRETGEEGIRSMKVPFEKAVEMAMKGEIKLMVSQLLILKAKEFLS
ncbi:NUDIX domain-containing protein [Nanoarchaeota archaeon]